MLSGESGGVTTGVEMRRVNLNKSTVIESMGGAGGGCEIIRYAWPKIKVVFSIQRENNTGPPSLQDPSAITKTGPHRVWPILFAQHPVDLVVVEKGDPCLPDKSPQPEARGASIAALQPLQRPKLIIEAWRSNAPLWGNGPTSKPALLLQSQHHFC